MDMILKYIVPILFAFYGYRFLMNPPPYLDKNGFATKRARESEDMWKKVHRIAGVVFIALALVILGAGFLLDYFLGADRSGVPQLALEVVCIAALIPLVNLVTRMKYGK